MQINIDKSLAIRAASILYARWIDAPMPGDKTRPMGGMNPVYACGTYMESVAKMTGLSCGRLNEDTNHDTLAGVQP